MLWLGSKFRLDRGAQSFRLKLCEGTGSLKLTTPARPFRRRGSKVLARNQLSPFADTRSSSTNLSNSTLSEGLRGNTDVRTSVIARMAKNWHGH
jgi:hypothetical protein